jgi:O-antigen/teichoic acid export membrane protein
LLGLGGSALLITVSNLIQAQGLGLLVGRMLGLEAAGIFGVVVILIINVQGVLSSLTTPFSTLASEWHSRDRLRDLAKISLMAMKLSGAIPAVFAVAVAIYGASGLQMLLHRSQWTATDFRTAAGALTIMSAGLAIGLPHMVARSILQGVGKHWTATAAVFAGTAASIGTSALLLAAGWGLNGAALGWTVMWLVQIPILLQATGPAYRSFGPKATWWGVLMDVHGPAIASAAVMLLIGGLITGILRQDTPIQLVAGLACSSVLTLPVLLRLCGLTSNGYLIIRDFVWKQPGTVSR